MFNMTEGMEGRHWSIRRSIVILSAAAMTIWCLLGAIIWISWLR